MARRFVTLAFPIICAQRMGSQPDEHPPLIVHRCSLDGCHSAKQSIVMDANWRWVHDINSSSNCFDDGEWVPTVCPDVATCAARCAVEGIDAASYGTVYGVTTSGTEARLNFVTSGNVGSRLYLLDQNATEYELFKLKGGLELAFDVDVSTLPCGVNGAVYLVAMDGDGGTARFPQNEAGARYGAGYCDAQCPHDPKFIAGEPNVLEWVNGSGKYGACCVEMDLWEANAQATAYTPHPCATNVSGQTRCSSPAECGDGNARYEGLCDKDGCDFHTYRLGAPSFYGPGPNFTVDTSRPFTIITQFIEDRGELVEIRRHYKQDGVLIPNPHLPLGGAAFDSVSNSYCAAEKSAFASNSTFAQRGGLASIGAALDRGMALVLSIWDDAASHMAWLDATDPPNSTAPGDKRGPCPASSGDPAVIEPGSKAHAVFSNLRWGPVGSTDRIFAPAPPTPPSPPPPPVCAAPFGQCGGKDWAGPTCCPPGQSCRGSEWYKGCA